MKKKKMLKAKYALAKSFLKSLLRSCQENHEFCGGDNEHACKGCNIYEMCQGNESHIEEWVIQQATAKQGVRR